MNILDQLHTTAGVYPDADFQAGGIATDVVECRSAVGVRYIIFRGDCDGGTETGVVTVYADDDATPTTSVATPFWYRASTTPDTWGAWTHAAAAGFTLTAGDNQIYEVFQPAAEIAENGYGYSHLELTEVLNDPVDGAILIEVIQTRYQDATTTMLT